MVRQTIEVDINVTQIIRELRGIEVNVNKGLSRGLNDAAFGLRRFWIADIKTFLDNPVAFTKKVFVKKSTPSNLVALTFLPPIQAQYLQNVVEGGVREVGDYASLSSSLLVPVNARVTAAGNFPQGPVRWLARLEERLRGAFVGAPGDSGRSAVYQRLRSGRLKLLAVFRQTVEYEKTLPLEATTATYVDQADREIQKNLDKLLQ